MGPLSLCLHLLGHRRHPIATPLQTVCCCRTGDGLLVVLDGAPPLHLHHTPLDAAVTDVAEVLGVLLHAVGHRVGGGGSEAALVLLKVLVVSHLESGDHTQSSKGNAIVVIKLR